MEVSCEALLLVLIFFMQQQRCLSGLEVRLLGAFPFELFFSPPMCCEQEAICSALRSDF